ncbi:MAG: urease accessory protein UreE [Pseudomonadales bacterium]
MSDLRIYTQHAEPDQVSEPCDAVALPFEERQKARQRVTLESGTEAGLKLARGTVLRNGDYLLSSQGHCIRIDAAPESVSRVTGADAQTLARAAYHLGNRHVWLQVGDGWLSYLHDHVLDDMIRGLGLTVTSVEQPFEPEAGAYNTQPHQHDGGPHHHH